MPYKDPVKRKEYQQQYQKRWYLDHKDARSLQIAEYAASHKSDSARRSAVYRKRHPDRIAVYKNSDFCSKSSKKYYIEHKTEVDKRNKIYYTTHKDLWREKTRRRYANSLGCRVKKSHYKDLYTNHPYCTYCGKALAWEQAEIDHYVPLSKGGVHEDSNLRIACKTCNRSKHAKLPEKFLASAKEV